MKLVVQKSKREILLATLVTLIGVIVLCIAEYVVSRNTAVEYNIEMWIDGCNILDFFFPLLVTLPFTWLMYFERKDGFIHYVSMRMDKRKHIALRIVTGMVVVFIMVFLIYYVGLVIAVTLLKPETVVNDGILYRYIWGDIQAEKSLVFGVIWCLWKALIGAIICGFGYGISLLVDNIFVIALLPFLYCTIENFITGTLQLERYSICTTYILNRLSPSNMHVYNYGFGIVTFVLFGTIIILTLYIRKRRVENSEECN